MPEASVPNLPIAQLSEFTSSLENCEWALTRAREAITSVVVGLKEHLRGSTLQGLLGAQAAVEAGPVVKIEPGSDEIDTTGATTPGQNNECERDLVPSLRMQALLQSGEYPSRNGPVVPPNDRLESTQLATALSAQHVPPENTYGKKKKQRTEQQRAARRERRRRAGARRQANRLAECMEKENVPRDPRLAFPSPHPSTIGTAANCEPLPFNRLSMPPPPNVNQSYVNAGAWSNGFIGPIYPADHRQEQIHSFSPVHPAPEFQTNSQQNFFFRSTVQPVQGLQHAPNIGGCYELEEGEIL